MSLSPVGRTPSSAPDPLVRLKTKMSPEPK
jgi:hypothetical protein